MGKSGSRGSYAVGRERRERIVEAATERFSTNGYARTSLARVAQDAGVSTTGLMHHFPTKQHLLLAVAEHRFDVAAAIVDASPGADGDALIEALLSITRRFVSEPGLIELFVALSAEAADPAGAIARVHSECLTGEALHSLKCECGPQLDAALEIVQREGGVVVYLRGHEGRGIGLINKLRAYSLQEEGLDTVDANLALGLPADAREYAAAAGILTDLGISKVRLLTNNTDKVAKLRDLGLDVVEQVPLIVGVGPNNHQYLETKRDRMGHIIGAAELAAALGKDDA